MDEFSRARMLLGGAAMDKLAESKVIVFGAGGVGSYVIEGLARCGIGAIDVVDNDTVAVTNINRQIIALNSTVGEYKADLEIKRILDINPKCVANSYKLFYSAENDGGINLRDYDYIVDAIDSVQSKIHLIKMAKELDFPIISSMGTGNKVLPEKLKIADISKTHTCPLAKSMRLALRKIGINHLKVLFSEELTKEHLGRCEDESGKGRYVGSISFVPSCAGLIIAGEVAREMVGYEL